MAGKSALLSNMIIDPAVRHCLPEKYQDKLGPFRSLAQGAKYMRMDISERCVPRKEKLHKLTCRAWSPLPKKNLKLEVNELIAQGLLLRAQLNMEMSAAQNAQLRHTRDVETGIRTLLQLPQLDTDTNVEVTAALLSKDMQRMRALLVHRATDEAERRAAAREQQSTASALSLPTSDIENARATASGPLPKKAQLEPSSASALVQDVAGAIHTCMDVELSIHVHQRAMWCNRQTSVMGFRPCASQLFDPPVTAALTLKLSHGMRRASCGSRQKPLCKKCSA